MNFCRRRIKKGTSHEIKKSHSFLLSFGNDNYAYNYCIEEMKTSKQKRKTVYTWKRSTYSEDGGIERERERGEREEKKRELLIFHLTLFNKKQNAEKKMYVVIHTHTHVKQPCTDKQKWWLEWLITFWTIIISMYFLHRIRAHIHGEVS